MSMKFGRRQLCDRRGRSTSLMSTLRFRGKRKTNRREAEGGHIYVDWVEPRIAGLAFFILTSSFLDAFLTLLHLQRGGQEVNPLMVLALHHGHGMFIVTKMTATGLGVWLLAAHQRFPCACMALYGLAGSYLLLLIYHIILIGHSLA